MVIEKLNCSWHVALIFIQTLVLSFSFVSKSSTTRGFQIFNCVTLASVEGKAKVVSV